MLFNEHISYFGLLCTISRLTGSLLVRYNKTKKVIELVPHFQRNHIFLRLKCLLNAFSVTAIVIQSYYYFIKDSNLLPEKSELNYEKFLVLINTAYVPFFLFTVVTFCKHSSFLVSYLNGHLQLCTYFHEIKKQGFIESKPVFSEKLNIFIAYTSTPSLIIFPFLNVFGLHWISPCKPSLIGYWLLPECEQSSKDSEINGWNFGFKFVIFSLNLWARAFLVYLMPFIFSGVYTFCTLSFQNYLKVFTWQASSKNKFDEETRKTYRSVQVLASIMIDAKLNIILGVVSMCVVIMQAACLASFVKFSRENSSNGAGILFFSAMVWVCGWFTMGVLGMQAGVYQESKGGLRKGKGNCLAKNMTTYERKLRQRFLTSCFPIRVGFGSINFVDRLTPLVCIDFANDLTVNLLLLK